MAAAAIDPPMAAPNSRREIFTPAILLTFGCRRPAPDSPSDVASGFSRTAAVRCPTRDEAVQETLESVQNGLPWRLTAGVTGKTRRRNARIELLRPGWS